MSELLLFAASAPSRGVQTFAAPPLNSVLLGDNVELMRTMPDAFFDAVATDAPYGLSAEPDMREVIGHWLNGDDALVNEGRRGFMGKSWDGFVPGPATWREAYRVLKPGGYLLCFAGSRTFDLMGLSIRLAGFECRDMVHWTYLNGFPKSLNVGNGRGTALKPSHEPILVCRKPFGTTVAENIATYGTGAMNIDACRVATAPGDEVEQHGRGAVSAVSKGIYGDSSAVAPGQSDGQKLGRWPPNTVFSHGVGCIRTGTAIVKATSGLRPKDTGHDYGPQNPSPALGAKRSIHGHAHADADADGNETVESWECEPGCPVAELDRQSGDRPVAGAAKTGRVPTSCNGNGVTSFDSKKGCGPLHNDKGGASRMFPCFDWQHEQDEIVAGLPAPFHYFAKPSPTEREAGCEDLPGQQQDESREPDAAGANNPRNRGGKTRKNNHATVKPIALMRWLVRLVTPPGGKVLDPFGGSGTTGCAAALEGLDFVLIECESASVDIARARVAHWSTKR